ncbi:MAG TPA: DUF421 domain-containing protein [Bacillota bacterium]|nr:DUF421 domain-containing protein [Bacillota bacterium]
MSNLLPMLYETLFGFTALFLLTKILGKTQISQLTAFDFITALVLGELVGNALFDEKAGILEIGYVILLWGGLLYIVEMVTQRFKRTRYLLEGKPAIVIHKGTIMRDVMKKNRIDIGELQHLLRDKSVFSIQEVEYAILETNGNISVLQKAPYQTPTKKDLNIPPSEPKIASTFISDGEVLWDNVYEAGFDESWLNAELAQQQYERAEDVFYAEYLEGEQLYILPFAEKPTRKKD